MAENATCARERVDERSDLGRRRRVVLAPLGWCQVGEVMISLMTVTKRSWTPGRARRKP